MSWIEYQDTKRAADEKTKNITLIYHGETYRTAFYAKNCWQTIVSCQSTFVYVYMQRNLVSSMRADHPRMPLVTLIPRSCGRPVRLDGSIQSDRLRQQGYHSNIHAGLLQELSICRGSAMGNFTYRAIEVLMLLDVPLKFKVHLQYKVSDWAHNSP